MNPEAQRIIIAVASCEPCVTFNIHCAIKAIPPDASRPPIIINKPIKKNIVFHSTSDKISFGFSNKSKTLAPSIAVTQVSICVISCITKPNITNKRTIALLINRGKSVIVFELSKFATACIFSGAAFKDFRNINIIKRTMTNKIINTTKVNSFKKSINESPAALPIMIFGGSPINVAVPPIFDAKISVIKNGSGFISNCFAIKKVTGIMRITVVTLSKNAEVTAVKIPRVKSTSFGCPLVSLKSSFAIQLNIPLLVAILTIIIIDTSKNITLKSTKLIK